MKTLRYEKVIAATPEKIWNILWGDATYPQWTKFFSGESSMRSDWKIAGKTYFLDGQGNGMVSTIFSLDAPNEIIFTHLGFIEDGIEDLSSEKIQNMTGAQEKYFLEYYDQQSTKLIVEVDVDEQWQDMMDNGFKQGLEIVKKLAE